MIRSHATAPSPIDWRHLARMTDDCGLLEHAIGPVPNRHHGYCVDDNGRALAIVCLAGDPTLEVLAERYLAFLHQAHRAGGHFTLRMTYSRQWLDDASDDASGRAIYGLGVAATHATWPVVRKAARDLYQLTTQFRSPYPRAMAYAALGAAEVAAREPEDPASRELLAAAEATWGPVPETEAWPWNEPRLTYANALLPAARLAVARVAGDSVAASDALRQLEWLRDLQVTNKMVSAVPAGGYGRGDVLPAFDQQPIEVWHLAEAAEHAWHRTRAREWLDTVEACARWFGGHNDAGTVMFDTRSGGTYDGLGRTGANKNQGAESVLAHLGVQLVVRRIAAVQAADSVRCVHT